MRKRERFFSFGGSVNTGTTGSMLILPGVEASWTPPNTGIALFTVPQFIYVISVAANAVSAARIVRVDSVPGSGFRLVSSSLADGLVNDLVVFVGFAKDLRA